jgi:hypothetical protein
LKCRIKNITELDGITSKVSHAQRVGRIGDLLPINVGYPMWIIYSDGHGTLRTSPINEIIEVPKEFIVKTQSTLYVLEKILS